MGGIRAFVVGRPRMLKWKYLPRGVMEDMTMMPDLQQLTEVQKALAAKAIMQSMDFAVLQTDQGRPVLVLSAGIFRFHVYYNGKVGEMYIRGDFEPPEDSELSAEQVAAVGTEVSLKITKSTLLTMVRTLASVSDIFHDGEIGARIQKLGEINFLGEGQKIIALPEGTESSHREAMSGSPHTEGRHPGKKRFKKHPPKPSSHLPKQEVPKTPEKEVK